MGDPQASLERLHGVLTHHQLLTDDGWLRPDVGLVSMGDHFDYSSPDPLQAAREGRAFLSWLATHDPGQVVILMGNHDAERVMCLSGKTLQQYRESKAACNQMLSCHEPAERRAFLESWIATHPDHPSITPSLDYKAYDELQGPLLRQLLLQGRIRLAATARRADGGDVLLTHAGVTLREYHALGTDVDATALAKALNLHLASAIHRAAQNWEEGGSMRLDLSPIYYGWSRRRANGGFLIHRPDARHGVLTHDQRLGLDPPGAPREVLPEKFLLPGLHQVVGHTVAGQRLVNWLGPLVTQAAKEAGIGPLLRLGMVDGKAILGTMEETVGAASSMTFTDVAMAVTPPENVQLLRLRG